MNCEKCLELISARLDGELTAQEEAQLTAHLQECPTCRALAEELKGMHSALANLGEVDAPPELSRCVMASIRAERTRSRRRFVRQLTGLAACLVLCVGVLRIVDVTYSEHNPHSADPNLPSVVRHIEPQPVVLNRLDAYSLPTATTTVDPFAHMLNSVDTLDRFLAQLSQTDLSAVRDNYNADFFQSNRLLAIVVQEPSSSITHRISELTDDSVTILRDVPEAGDCDMALWLILAEVEGSGPETPLEVELISN